MIKKFISFILSFFLIILSNWFILYFVSEFFNNELWFSLIPSVNSNYTSFMWLDLIWLFLVGLWFWFFDGIVKYILNIISLPLRIMTMGFFSFIVNIIILYLLQFVLSEMVDIWYTIALWNLLQTMILSFVLSFITFICKYLINLFLKI